MASFCKQCSEWNFQDDYGDFKDLSTEKDTKDGKFCVVLCEGCGPCQVDHNGLCISPDCLEKHDGKEQDKGLANAMHDYMQGGSGA